jgi:hypothetical protein
MPHEQNPRPVKELPSTTTNAHPIASSPFSEISLVRQEKKWSHASRTESPSVPADLKRHGDDGGDGDAPALWLDPTGHSPAGEVAWNRNDRCGVRVRVLFQFQTPTRRKGSLLLPAHLSPSDGRVASTKLWKGKEQAYVCRNPYSPRQCRNFS